jgi:hypothetical protein
MIYTRAAFDEWRKKYPGSKSQNAFRVWRGLGGRDRPGYRGGQRRRRWGGGQVPQTHVEIHHVGVINLGAGGS